MSNSNFFDVPRVTRMIAMGYPQEQILPLFLPLVRQVINNSVAYDSRNMTGDDLEQVGLLKSMDIINTFRLSQGGLFQYAITLLKHALWYEAKLKRLDKQRITDEIDFDSIPKAVDPTVEFEKLRLSEKVLERIRTEVGSEEAAQYVFGVLTNNDYASNRERVLKTLTNGFDVNPKHARYLTDHVLVILRTTYSNGVKEVRNDRLFRNKFQFTLIPELRNLVGERAFERIVHFFGGLTINVPSVDTINSIDRDLAILKALAHDWTCGPILSKKYGISPEGIKAVYKACLHKLHSDKEYRELVHKTMPLDTIPGYEDVKTRTKKIKSISNFGQRRAVIKRKPGDTDSMGFKLGCRNSLIYTLIVTGKCSRQQITDTLIQKFGGELHSAKSTVSAFLSDIKQPFGKFNTSRNLKILVNSKGQLSFEAERLAESQRIIAEKIQAQMVASA